METIVQDFDELQTRAFRQAPAVTASAYPPGSRMQGEHLVRFLDGHRFGVIATSRPDWVAVWIRIDPVRLFSYAADGSPWAPPA